MGDDPTLFSWLLEQQLTGPIAGMWTGRPNLEPYAEPIDIRRSDFASFVVRRIGTPQDSAWAAIMTPGVVDAFVAGDRGEIAVAYLGLADARDVWANVNRSRHAGIRFEPEAVICLGSSCTWDASDFAPDVEFTEADALMIGAELGYSGDTDSLVVHADWLMSQGSAEGLEVAAWLSDRDLP